MDGRHGWMQRIHFLNQRFHFFFAFPFLFFELDELQNGGTNWLS